MAQEQTAESTTPSEKPPETTEASLDAKMERMRGLVADRLADIRVASERRGTVFAGETAKMTGRLGKDMRTSTAEIVSRADRAFAQLDAQAGEALAQFLQAWE